MKTLTVIERLMNGMPMDEFLTWFILSMAGAFLYLIIRFIMIFGPVGSAAPSWSWKEFWKGILKLIATLIICPWFILYSDEIIPYLLIFLFTFPDLDEETVKGVAIELNGASAFLLGFCIDFIVYRAIRKIQKRKQ